MLISRAVITEWLTNSVHIYLFILLLISKIKCTYTICEIRHNALMLCVHCVITSSSLTYPLPLVLIAFFGETCKVHSISHVEICSALTVGTVLCGRSLKWISSGPQNFCALWASCHTPTVSPASGNACSVLQLHEFDCSRFHASVRSHNIFLSVSCLFHLVSYPPGSSWRNSSLLAQI